MQAISSPTRRGGYGFCVCGPGPDRACSASCGTFHHRDCPVSELCDLVRPVNRFCCSHKPFPSPFLALWLFMPPASPLPAVSHFLFPHALVHRVIELHSRRRRVIKLMAVHTSDVCRPNRHGGMCRGETLIFFPFSRRTHSAEISARFGPNYSASPK